MLVVILISLIAWCTICGFLVLEPNKGDASNSTTITTAISPRTILLNPSLLAKAKQEVNKNNNSILQASLRQLLLQANSFLTKTTITVTQKIQLAASGDKHDYLSLSPYDWPDPTKPNGLPYILHDGIVNPEVYSIPDRQNLDDMIHRVKILSLAYYFTENPQYASKAEGLLRVWFLDNSTHMNPNLQYAEMEPGKNNGTSSGIMDANNIPQVIDAICLIKHSSSWTLQDQNHMERWFNNYLDWLLTSDAGSKEAQANNNHKTWYDVQVSSIALFLNKTDIAKHILQSSTNNLIASQIQPDGRQPFELRRTNSWDYSIFNLEGLFVLASIAQHIGVDLWNYKMPQGAGIQAALDYLLPFSLKNQTWPYPQIGPTSTKNLASLLCQATLHYKNNNPSYYLQSYKSMDIKNASLDNLIYMCSGS